MYNYIEKTIFAVITGVATGSVRAQAEASIANNMRNEKNNFDMGSSRLIVLLHYLAEHPETAGIAASILNKTEFP